MLTLSRILNTTLVAALILLGVIWFYPPAAAADETRTSVISQSASPSLVVR